MLWRVLLGVLISVNIALFAWYRFTAPTPPPPQAEPEVPQLVLLREREAQLLAEQTVRLGGGELGPGCFSLGPFTNQSDLARAFNVIAPHIARSRQRQSVEMRDRGWWVYLPAVASREMALDQARQLARDGIKDYYVVTTGEDENTVSLGLFGSEANAARRRDALITLGYPAEMELRREETRLYWLDYAEQQGSDVPWESVAGSDLEHRPIPCFK